MSENSLPGPGERFLRGILPDNPTYRQMLGMCPTLAVSNSMQGAVTMAGATAFVLIMSNLVISLLRNLIVPHLRIPIYTVTIAAFVTIADRALQAFLPEMSMKLGPYIPLIIVNCIIIGRAEVCAALQGPWTSLMDAFGQSIGFLLGLSSLGIIREILGSGALFGHQILPASAWDPWIIMILPPGAFITLGAWMGVMNWLQARQTRARKEA